MQFRCAYRANGSCSNTCVYSPGSSVLKPRPSCLRRPWNTTVRVGALTPMAKVSVQNRTCRGNAAALTSAKPCCNSWLQSKLRYCWAGL